jgi:hypothetical protein
VPNAPPTRGDLSRALVLNALVRPVNLAVPALVLVAGALVDARWLALVALASWLALACNTFFDEREAERAGERLRERREPREPHVDPGAFTPVIGGRVKAALRARVLIDEAIAASGFPLDDVAREVDTLVDAIGAYAVRADRIHSYLLSEESPETLERRIAQESHEGVRGALEAKLAALARLRQRLDGLKSEMDHVVATLQTVQAEILAAEGAERGFEERALAGQVSELRERVELFSAGLDEAFADTRAQRAP